MKPSATSRRRTVRASAVGALALVAGVLPGAGSQAQEQRTRLTADYECAFPSGTRQIEVEFSGRFPEVATAGQPVRIGAFHADVALPQQALEKLLPAGTESVTSEAELTVGVAQGGSSADARWDGLRAGATPVPAEQDLSLAHRGTVPPVTAARGGELGFTAGALALDITPAAPATEQPATEQPTGEKPATPPATAPVRIGCRPAERQDLLLATVRIGGPADGAGSSASPTGSGAPDPSASHERPEEEQDAARRSSGLDVGTAQLPPARPCEQERPTGELDRSKLPEPPPGIPVRESPIGGIHWCAVPVAVSNVYKLRGAMVINDPRDGATTANLLIQKEWAVGPGYNQLRHLGELDLPDARATFLDFDFMPVSAGIEFTSSPMTIVTVQRGSSAPNYATIYLSQTLRMHDVKVNGVPLDVGPRCRTARPVELELQGKQPEYEVLKGGILRAKFEIPPFTGCGTGGEDLDPLFTASLSGGGNYLKLVQGPPCLMRPGGLGCVAPPKVPELPK
ncbi:DUF6801 domain-containing protein [Streptomyces qinglanensis]|uniref:DUF6801 domain-containing protein n=1 Tax=Streptomyces qinglanensis TaxID=943816 RepID=A0A1H9TH76_9ACTN|nr:DUF6801 domain-containing protein [Streptomyces qinglanensis]SER96690.1 hypothetical protein SAMN05421870_106159 [Streptomyces qinglanensis]